MELIELERRANPSPIAGWDGPTRVAYLPDGGTVAAAGEGGGPRVVIADRDGVEVASFFAFEPAFRGGCLMAISPSGIVVGPGPGGGPVRAVFDFHGVEVDRAFVGDPGSRAGFDPGAGGGVVAAVPVAVPVAAGDPNAVAGEAGSLTRYDLDLTTFAMVPAGPTPVGVGLVFRAAGDPTERSQLPRAVLAAIGSADFYVATGPLVGRAKSLPRYVEVVADGLSVGEIVSRIHTEL